MFSLVSATQSRPALPNPPTAASIAKEQPSLPPIGCFPGDEITEEIFLRLSEQIIIDPNAPLPKFEVGEDAALELLLQLPIQIEHKITKATATLPLAELVSICINTCRTLGLKTFDVRLSGSRVKATIPHSYLLRAFSKTGFRSSDILTLTTLGLTEKFCKMVDQATDIDIQIILPRLPLNAFFFEDLRDILLKKIAEKITNFTPLTMKQHCLTKLKCDRFLIVGIGNLDISCFPHTSRRYITTADSLSRSLYKPDKPLLSPCGIQSLVDGAAHLLRFPSLKELDFHAFPKAVRLMTEEAVFFSKEEETAIMAIWRESSRPVSSCFDYFHSKFKVGSLSLLCSVLNGCFACLDEEMAASLWNLFIEEFTFENEERPTSEKLLLWILEQARKGTSWKTIKGYLEWQAFILLLNREAISFDTSIQIVLRQKESYPQIQWILSIKEGTYALRLPVNFKESWSLIRKRDPQVFDRLTTLCLPGSLFDGPEIDTTQRFSKSTKEEILASGIIHELTSKKISHPSTLNLLLSLQKCFPGSAPFEDLLIRPLACFSQPLTPELLTGLLRNWLPLLRQRLKELPCDQELYPLFNNKKDMLLSWAKTLLRTKNESICRFLWVELIKSKELDNRTVILSDLLQSMLMEGMQTAFAFWSELKKDKGFSAKEKASLLHALLTCKQDLFKAFREPTHLTEALIDQTEKALQEIHLLSQLEQQTLLFDADQLKLRLLLAGRDADALSLKQSVTLTYSHLNPLLILDQYDTLIKRGDLKEAVPLVFTLYQKKIFLDQRPKNLLELIYSNEIFFPLFAGLWLARDLPPFDKETLVVFFKGLSACLDKNEEAAYKIAVDCLEKLTETVDKQTLIESKKFRQLLRRLLSAQPIDKKQRSSSFSSLVRFLKAEGQNLLEQDWNDLPEWLDSLIFYQASITMKPDLAAACLKTLEGSPSDYVQRLHWLSRSFEQLPLEVVLKQLSEFIEHCCSERKWDVCGSAIPTFTQFFQKAALVAQLGFFTKIHNWCKHLLAEKKIKEACLLFKIAESIANQVSVTSRQGLFKTIGKNIALFNENFVFSFLMDHSQELLVIDWEKQDPLRSCLLKKQLIRNKELALLEKFKPRDPLLWEALFKDNRQDGDLQLALLFCSIMADSTSSTCWKSALQPLSLQRIFALPPACFENTVFLSQFLTVFPSKAKEKTGWVTEANSQKLLTFLLAKINSGVDRAELDADVLQSLFKALDQKKIAEEQIIQDLAKAIQLLNPSFPWLIGTIREIHSAKLLKICIRFSDKKLHKEALDSEDSQKDFLRLITQFSKKQDREILLTNRSLLLKGHQLGKFSFMSDIWPHTLAKINLALLNLGLENEPGTLPLFLFEVLFSDMASFANEGDLVREAFDKALEILSLCLIKSSGGKNITAGEASLLIFHNGLTLVGKMIERDSPPFSLKQILQMNNQFLQTCIQLIIRQKVDWPFANMMVQFIYDKVEDLLKVQTQECETGLIKELLATVVLNFVATDPPTFLQHLKKSKKLVEQALHYQVLSWADETSRLLCSYTGINPPSSAAGRNDNFSLAFIEKTIQNFLVPENLLLFITIFEPYFNKADNWTPEKELFRVHVHMIRTATLDHCTIEGTPLFAIMAKRLFLNNPLLTRMNSEEYMQSAAVNLSCLLVDCFLELQKLPRQANTPDPLPYLLKLLQTFQSNHIYQSYPICYLACTTKIIDRIMPHILDAQAVEQYAFPFVHCILEKDPLKETDEIAQYRLRTLAFLITALLSKPNGEKIGLEITHFVRRTEGDLVFNQLMLTLLGKNSIHQ